MPQVPGGRATPWQKPTNEQVLAPSQSHESPHLLAPCGFLASLIMKHLSVQYAGVLVHWLGFLATP